MKQFSIFLLGISLAAFASCSKVPSKVISPSADLELVTGEEKGKIKLRSGLNNENSDVVFTSVKGTIHIINPATKKSIFAVPFSIKEILPLSSGRILVKNKQKRIQYW
jgi:hypothetical protein